MYANRQVRQILHSLQNQTKHRHQVHVIIISVSVILLFYITIIKHVKLRNTDTLMPDNSVEFRKVDSFQEFDYDIELTEDERRILSKMFKSADFDNNKLLTESEVAMAINRETKQHIMKAMRSNFKVFFSLDKIHKNGQIDWDEYYQYFTRTRMGLEDGDIRRLETDPRSASREVREALAEVKAAWSEAARTNPDAVNIDEFLGLEHPESSHTLLTQRVEEMMEKHDADGDGKLTLTEYISDPYRELDKGEEALREHEFKGILDKNKDGIADKREVVQFLDPKNSHWSRYEAINLISQADRNGDGLLDLEEVLGHPDLFLFSKLAGGDAGFHGEF